MFFYGTQCIIRKRCYRSENRPMPLKTLIYIPKFAAASRGTPAIARHLVDQYTHADQYDYRYAGKWAYERGCGTF